MTKTAVDLAHLTDIPELVRLEKICFTTDRLTAKQFRHFIQSHTALVATLKNAKQVIGDAVLLFRKNSSIARLYSIAIDPSFQQCGMGQTLYDFIEQHANPSRTSEIRLEVRKDNSRAIHFYQKNGYQLFGEYARFYEDGADALRMRKIMNTVQTR